jgi:Icc protein
MPNHDHDDNNHQRFDDETNTRPTGSNYIVDDNSTDGVDRRGFLRCMAWAGTATLWGLSGGIPVSFQAASLKFLTESQRKSIFFAQISDSHIGFNKEANKDVTATLQEPKNSIPRMKF